MQTWGCAKLPVKTLRKTSVEVEFQYNLQKEHSKCHYKLEVRHRLTCRITIFVVEKKQEKMSSKRNLKKYVNNMVFDLVDECFHIQESDPKKEKKTEALFDKVADFQDEILQEIHAAKTKKDYNPIVAKINDMQVKFTEELNGLN